MFICRKYRGVLLNKNYHHGDLRNQLIEKGLILLSTEGIAAFSLRKVAKLCEVSHTAPYRHFQNKDELIQAIAREGFIKFHSTLKKASEEFPNDPRRQFERLGELYLYFAIENPDYMRILFSNTLHSSAFQNSMNEFSEFGFEQLRSCIRQCMKLPSFRFKNEKVATLTAWSYVHGLSILIIEKNNQKDFNLMEVAALMSQSETDIFFDD